MKVVRKNLRFIRNWHLRSIGVLFILLLGAPGIINAAWINAGMLNLRNDRVEASGLTASTVPYEIRSVPVTLQTIAYFQHALALDNTDLTAHWALGRAWLARGDADQAAEELYLLLDQAAYHPLLAHDLVIALGLSSKFDTLVALYEKVPLSKITQSMSDTIALAYLQIGPTDINMLEKAHQLRPDDLYANYFLWQAAVKAGNAKAADAHRKTLVQFSLEAIHPTDERLLDQASKVIPFLVEQGLWDQNCLLNVVTFLVWQHHDAPGVEHLLERLIAAYPDEPDWLFYLGELYHRRGNLERATDFYQQLLTVAPNYAQAHLRLGMLNEAASWEENKSNERLNEAVQWYTQYHTLVPDDLLGLRKLTKVYEALDKPEAITLREETAIQTDPQRLAAEMLGVSMEKVALGPNLVKNGGFEIWMHAQPQDWAWSNMATGDQWSKGLFAGGSDNLDTWDSQTARIDGLWLEQSESMESGRCGYWHVPIPLKARALYLITFSYRTVRSKGGGPSLWLSWPESVVFPGEHFLPDTAGSWRQFAVIGWSNVAEKPIIQPLLRLWGPGIFMFDSVQVHEITLTDEIVYQEQPTLFALR